ANLARCRAMQKEKDKDAEPAYEAAIEQLNKTLGDDHPTTLAATLELAAYYYGTGRLKVAIPVYEAVFAKSKQRLGEDSPETLQRMEYLAGAYYTDGRQAESLDLC